MLSVIMEGQHKYSHFIRLLIIVLILHYCLLSTSAISGTNITTDQSALFSLKSHVTSDPNDALRSWTLSSFVCSWSGITCGARHRRVIALNISNFGLTGEIPPEFGNLSFIVSLDLRNNNFIGTLSENLSRLRRLRFIRLSYNSFSGEVPPWFAFLPQLQLLSFKNNTFTNMTSFFDSFSNQSKLETLDMSFNSLQGEIPQSITNLGNLKQLSMEGNRLSGSIPSLISNMSSLETLILSNNLLQGSIPQGIGDLRRLNWLNVEGNGLTGSIPLSLFNVSTLELVSFTENSLSGSLPDDMCNGLPFLQGVYLSFNEISGKIPSSFSSCPQLQTLSLSNNKFSGTIPVEIGSLEMLQILYLGFNELTGEIPSEIGKIQNLQFLGMENNFLRGTIPFTIFNMSFLQRLSLAQNELDGYIREDIGNLTMLTELYLGHNNFTGVVPRSISKLTGLEALDLGTNRLTGNIHSDIFNISTLILISLTSNSFSGNLPANIGEFLPNLAQLFLGQNNLEGVLPSSILNSSQLMVLDLSVNKFNGPIPNSIGDLRLLQVLNLEMNNFTTSESVSSELSFIAFLTNCRYLTELAVSYNPLNGILPSSVGNLSSSLQTIYASNCNIKGDIPIEVGNLSGLVSLYFYGNDLTGFIPTTLSDLSSLQRLSLGNNRLIGSIPNDLCELQNLGAFYLSENRLTGAIPTCLGNVSTLRNIHLYSNNLSSVIPASIWNLQDLLELDISSNSFSGSLSPQIGNLKAVTFIDLSRNQFLDDIPSAFGGLQKVTNLSLAYNNFRGPIPDSIGTMLSLVSLDLSYNKLTGKIPKSLETLRHLEYFNVSYNELSGDIPTAGPFKNFTSQSFASNTALCGASRFKVSSCREPVQRSNKNRVLKAIFIPLGIGLLVFVTTVAFILVRYRRKNKPPTVADISASPRPARISYYELLQATDRYSEDNLLGKGSFGSVYKGVLQDGTIVAVKVFNMQAEGALKNFDAECEVLRNLRHRNLAKVISSCSNEDFKAIVLEYMPNGSLEKWLYSDNYFLDMMQRLDIMIDVACALEYLHHGYSTPVIHCDLKPGNVLIDGDMVARVSDFGMTRFLSEDESITHTRTLATLGYMAPEYGLEGIVSARGDVYSYGIMLLETFTRKRPSDEMFGGDTNLKRWVKDSLPDEFRQVIDANLVSPEEEKFSKKLSCLLSVLELALSCLADSPGERMNVKDVLTELKKIKLQFTQMAAK